MDRLVQMPAVRLALRAAALACALALVAGVRPRMLAEETGVAPLASNACYLCDGSVTAATVSPAADTVSLPIAASPTMLSPLEAAVALVVPGAPLGDPVQPPAPPPRA